MDKHGDPIPLDYFANETDEEALFKSEAIDEKQLAKEVAAIDALLDGDDSPFDKLDY